MAYFLEAGLLLLVAPWTVFWEHNTFVVRWPAFAAILLSPWFRGAMSGVGVVTIGAALLDLLGLFVGRETIPPESARTSN